VPRHSAPKQPAWLRPRVAVAFVVATAGLVAAIWLPTRGDSADAAERDLTGANDGRWNRGAARASQAFADDFDGRDGSTVDPGKWLLLADGRFSQSTRNARLDGDGNLVITARREGSGAVTSALLLTKDMLQAASGHVEARIKAPEGRSVVPAFKVLAAGTDQTRTGQFGAGQFGPGQFGPGQFGPGVDVLAEPLPDGFHTYALDWTRDEAVLSVDGREVRRLTPEALDGDRPFRLSLSLTVRDRNGGAALPARMLVDSVSFSADGGPTTAPTTAPTSPSPSEPTDPPGTPPTSAPTTSPSTSPSTSPTPTAAPTTTAPVATEWKPFTDYVAGQLVTYKGVEYQVQETHTSLPGWEPTALPNLFKKV
jgi:hypothetical protein